ncbi:VWA-like domain-containing protein [Actinoplanes sp. NPDC026670]|uniref:vWA domain-containing protein n=1 Tax=Actinoplanes sp. NPDC026670 TaxID=3154700 RepID=UPI0033D92415
MSPGLAGIRAEIDAAARDLLIREPYYGHLLVGMIRLVTDGDAGIRLVPAGPAPGLAVSAAGWADLSPAARTACLRHELLHLTLKHPLRASAYGSLQLWGLACDLVVNQLCDTAALPGAVTVADVGLPPGRTADDYYAMLREPYTRACQGGDPDGSAGDGPADEVVAAVRAWLDGPAARCHEAWRDFAALPAATLATFTHGVETLLATTVRRATVRGWGPLPAELVEILELVIRPPQVPWRRVLRMFGATSERTRLRTTLSRPSARYGTSPGVRVRRSSRLVVAVDTSGSVAAADLTAFFSEIHAMWRRGVEVTVLEADVSVHREYRYRGRPPETVSGRGGTGFDPAIRRANELGHDGLVYLTDGFAPRPAVASRTPLLWVLTAGDSVQDLSHLPGRRVRLTGRNG